MARNRKRTRDRRPRRPDSPSALATANGEPGEENANPLAHASPDTELAEAQLALGRPELSEVPDEEELDELAEEAGEGADDGGSAGYRGAGGDAGAGGGRRRGGGGEETPSPASGAAVPAHVEPWPARLSNFLRGSWRELQRVQWPDRRQVFQATGVVLGFVIVAGVFLGVADVVAQKVVNLLLYGHT